MKKVILIVFVIHSISLFAQDPPNHQFNQVETIPCPFDPSQTVETYVNWLLYQTIDNTWSGVMDSSICISYGENGPNEGIDLSTVDINRSIFIRSKMNDDTKRQLNKNALYTVAGNIRINTGWVEEFIGGVDCPDGFCTGLIIGIEIPDSSGTGTNMRWYIDYLENNDGGYHAGMCISSEYFEENYLKEFIFKVTLPNGIPLNRKVKPFWCGLTGVQNYLEIKSIIAPETTFVDTSYEVPIETIAEGSNPWGGNFLLRYADTTSYPSSENQYYIEGKPEINSTSPKVINLLIDYQTIVPQPYTSIRGGLVEGSDSIRHTVNLINEGGDLCLGMPIDFVFENGSRYIHRNGKVNFHGLSGCMMFKDQSILKVDDGATLNYGSNGKGILALRPGSTIEIGNGSTLHIDNLLWLQGIPNDENSNLQIYMRLNHGSTLSFGEDASITNVLSKNENTKLNIYMDGGELIDGNLTSSDKLLINKIYPEPSIRFIDNIKIYPNPVTDILSLEYIASENEEVELKILDIKNILIGKETYKASKGNNTFQYNVSAIPVGVYIAHFRTGKNQIAVKVVKN